MEDSHQSGTKSFAFQKIECKNMIIRKLKKTETEFLEDMLYEAIFIPEEHEPLPREVIKDKSLS